MTLVYFLISILFLILIHEWGHFAAARFFGIGVEKFSIGFGKALFSYTDRSTGTRWQMGPIPLGGFVGLLGEKADDSPSASVGSVQGKPFMQAPLHAKIIVLLAGVTVNLMFAVVAYAWLAFNVANPALPIVSAPAQSSPAHEARIESGDLILSVNGQTVQSWRDVQVSLINALEPQSSSPQSGVKLEVLRGGKPLQLELAAPELDGTAGKATAPVEELLGLRLRALGLKVQGFSPASASEQAGVQLEDFLTRVDGLTIDHQSVLIDRLKAYNPDSLGVELAFTRGGEPQQLRVVPLKDSQGAYKLGIQFAAIPQLSEQAVSAGQSIKEGFATTYLASILTVKALFKFLRNPLKSEELAGPVTIAKTAKASADRGWQAALAFLAGLSVSVGVLNLLPVPVLDGGQVLYHLGRSAISWLKKLKLFGSWALKSESSAVIFDKIWLSFGVAFVVLLTVAAFYTDFQRILSGL